MVRLPEALLAAIDDWRRKELDLPTRSEALRRLAIAALKQIGGEAKEKVALPAKPEKPAKGGRKS
jgi:hypothetical protein